VRTFVVEIEMPDPMQGRYLVDIEEDEVDSVIDSSSGTPKPKKDQDGKDLLKERMHMDHATIGKEATIKSIKEAI
jgi:hypothetical protein